MMTMSRLLTQQEIDELVDALTALRSYTDESSITDDILNNQVVLTQAEIDRLIESLNTVKDLPFHKPDVNVVLTQTEIDSLIDALNSIKEYGQLEDFKLDILNNQTVLSQDEIDALIQKLLSIKRDA